MQAANSTTSWRHKDIFLYRTNCGNPCFIPFTPWRRKSMECKSAAFDKLVPTVHHCAYQRHAEEEDISDEINVMLGVRKNDLNVKD